MKNELTILNQNKEVRINSVELTEIINKFRQEEFNILKEKGLNKKDKCVELQHKSFISKIKNELETLKILGLDTEQNILLSEYKDSTGRKLPCYSLNRDGMLQMLNSESAIVRAKTIQYIDKLEEENKKLKETISEKDRLLLGLFSDDKMVVAQSHKALVELEKKPLLDKIEEDKPKVTFADTIIESSDTIDISKLAKLVKDENIPLGRNKLFQWLRDNKYLMKDNIPYQRYIDMKLFECKEYTYKTPYGDKNGIKTLVTGKGQVYIIEKLKECFK